MTQIEGIVSPLAQALTKRGYTDLTPVQKAMADPALVSSDVLVSAQTGSGKTVAFGLAIAPTLLGEAETFGRADIPLTLIVAPTRELALQVSRELEWLYEMTGAKIATCVGGMDMRNERRTLERGAHIVVGTPGRLKDHILRKSLDMSAMRAIVLDEADEMLDLGFREDLEFILGEAPEERRTLMFSATVPRSIAALAKSYQKDAVRVSTTAERDQHVDIEYRAMTVAPSDRENAIINVLRYYEASNALVFCGTRAMVNHLTARLNNRGFSVVALSGELSQNERSHALQAMRDGRARVCVATDVAARGIDLPGLELVVHADLPSNSETLLHRSGRTGRAGNKGVSAIIVPQNFRKKAERLLQGAKVNATWAPPPSATEVIGRDNERLLGDPMLTEPVGKDDLPFVQQLLELHTPEQLAAAFVRVYRAKSSAPEELNDKPLDTKKPAKEDFGASVWISVSVGRNQQAEPRWLLPLLCRSGDITKQEIGAIRMQPEETHVQLAAGCFDAFMTAIGPKAELEDGIRVTRMNGTPEGADSPRPERAERGPRPERSPRPDRPERSERPAFGERKPYTPKDDAAPRKPYSPDRNADDAPRTSTPYVKKPYAAKSDAGRKPYLPETTDGAVTERAKPKGKFSQKPPYKSEGKPAGKPAYRSEGKPSGDKPAFKGGKPAGGKPPFKGKPTAAGKFAKAGDSSVSLRKPRTKPAK